MADTSPVETTSTILAYVLLSGLDCYMLSLSGALYVPGAGEGGRERGSIPARATVSMNTGEAASSFVSSVKALVLDTV
jgi:hypothetical protein